MIESLIGLATSQSEEGDVPLTFEELTKISSSSKLYFKYSIFIVITMVLILFAFFLVKIKPLHFNASLLVLKLVYLTILSFYTVSRDVTFFYV